MKFKDFLAQFRKIQKIPNHPVLIQTPLPNLPGGERLVILLRPRSPLVIGRGSNVDLQIRNQNVSSRHAQFHGPKPGQGGWNLVDLGSTNGTFVQDRPLPPHDPVAVADKATVRFGPSLDFRFLEGASLERLLRREAGRSKPPARPARAGSDRNPKAAPAAVEKPAHSAPTPTAKPAPRPASAPAETPREVPRAEPAPMNGGSERPATSLPDDFVERCLRKAREQDASDLHLAPTLPPVLRVNGDLIQQDDGALSANDLKALVWQVTNTEQRDCFFESGDLDACVELAGLRYRLNLCKSRSGCAISFRLIQERVPTLEELRIPANAEELTKYAQGMVLITGPLGSGKTTTMFALVDLVNRNRPENIITIEDPVEFLLPPKKCQVAQRERGPDTASFGAALRGALREDPDIIVIGDLRDYETATLAISAAETGHLVFASMATMNATKTIDKLIDLFPAGEQATTRTMFSESLRGILCQHLLPGTDGKRVPAVELVFNSIAIANIIREGKTANLLNAMQMGKAQGMRSFETSLTELVKSGAITKETAAEARAG